MSEIRPAPFKTRVQHVLHELRTRIMDGVLAPGTRLLLKPIAESFGCSEIPVREAFRSLESEGLITVLPHVGAFVSLPKVDDLVHLTEIRSLLEPEATVSAAACIDKAAIVTLREMLADMADMLERRSYEEYGRLNRRFHEFIMDRAPNQRLVTLIKEVWSQCERARLVYQKGQDFLVESLHHHVDIVDAIERRDLAALRTLVTMHSQYGLDAVRSLAAGEAVCSPANEETRA
jgi:DNA-binding GntR family transcriptional regulator